MADNGTPGDVKIEAHKPQPPAPRIQIHAEVEQVVAMANTDRRTVLIHFQSPGGVVEVEMVPELADNVLPIIKRASTMAKTGIVPASGMPPDRG